MVRTVSHVTLFPGITGPLINCGRGGGGGGGGGGGREGGGGGGREGGGRGGRYIHVCMSLYVTVHH